MSCGFKNGGRGKSIAYSDFDDLRHSLLRRANVLPLECKKKKKQQQQKKKNRRPFTMKHKSELVVVV